MQNSNTDIEQTEYKSVNSQIDPSQVKGWGIDANPQNDPTYPMRKRVEGEHSGYNWERPTQQPIDVEILHSNERPNIAATFGTANPPAGISGLIRRGAFKYSENSYGHWVPLMLADRVGMIEGIVSDLARGRIPNIFDERGLKAEWKHNRANLLTKIIVGAAVAGIAVTLLSRNRNDFETDD